MNYYKKWLLNKVNFLDCEKVDALYATAFEYSLLLDENRISDALNLRYEFDGRVSGPVNCLEVMVALSIRCEHDVLDIGYSERGLIFREMMKNLFVTAESPETQIQRMLHREYDPDGYGGLFYIPGIEEDMRTTHIYHQAMIYINRRIYNDE